MLPAKVSRLGLAALVFAAFPSAGEAQGSTSGTPASTYDGAFARAYPGAGGLLHSAETFQAALLDQQFAEAVRGSDSEDHSFEGLTEQLRARTTGPGSAGSPADAMPSMRQASPDLVLLLERTAALRREMLDIYADERVVDKIGSVEASIDRYLASDGAVLPVTPKKLEIVLNPALAPVEADLDPLPEALLRATTWLQLAVFDPLLFYGTGAERDAGVDLVADRFLLKLSSADSLPANMPTPAAIAPELVRTHPRAAVIFDNLTLLEGLIRQELAAAEASRASDVLRDVVSRFTDPGYLATSEYDWMLTSLRSGIFLQGGPAIGTLARSERNVDGHHMHHGGGIVSGMGSGPDGGVLLPDAETPDGDTSQHQH